MRAGLVLLPLLMASSAVLGQPAAAAKPRPRLILHMENILPGEWPSMQATSDLETGTLRDGDSIYRYSPAQPSSVKLEKQELPSKMGACLATTLGAELYYQAGKDLRKRSADGRTDKVWFTPPRPFASFQVLDAFTVALGMVHDTGDTKPVLYRSLDKEEVAAVHLQFLEPWDVPSRTLIEAHPLPQEVERLFELAQPFPLHQMWMLRSREDLLIFLPRLQHLYLLNRTRPRITRLEVPWPQVDADWIGAALRPGQSMAYLFAFYFPQSMLACPVEGGGFTFTWNQLPLREDIALRYETQAFRGIDGSVLRHGPLSKDASAPVTHFHLAEWRPGDTSLKSVKARGRIPLEDNAALRAVGWWMEYQRFGLFVDSLLEPMPLPQFFKGLKQTLESRQAAPVPPPSKKAPAVPAEKAS